MIAFDTTFLVDYLDGDGATQTFLENRETKPFYAPSLALFEAYRGAATTAGPAGIERVATGLDWIDPLVLSDGAAREAAAIEAELLENGTPINLGDVLIAGVCRHNGAHLVTRDSHFERVDGLETETY
ncbi:PIN domain-containing protein [Natronorubrum sp. DTA7]|uniref:PIN domain-containing protein n=1 Tax=Natronorubrum sp. DTA7 TaxID=3447016 RepID=UPI003F82CFF4